MRELDHVVRDVEIRPLAEVLAEHASDREIHFLKVDVEGAEREVLVSNDWARFRPWIVVVEATIPDSPETCHEIWEDVLTGAGYVRAFFDGLNMYYCRDDKAALAAALDRPINVFDGFRKFEPEVAAMHAALGDAMRRVSALEAELAAARTERDLLIGERDDLLSERDRTIGERDALFAEQERERHRVRHDGATERLLRLQTRYHLEGATRELRLGLWLARRLRKADAALARLVGRRYLALRPMKARFLANAPAQQTTQGAPAPVAAALAQEPIPPVGAKLEAVIAEIRAAEARTAAREQATAEGLEAVLLALAARASKS